MTIVSGASLLMKEWVRDKPYQWATRLLEAKTESDIDSAFSSASQLIQNELKPLNRLILNVLKERTFPKKQETQLDFLADSLAGYGRISPRRSRDICEKERKKKVHQIIREEFYIECTCGYKGPALRGACPKLHPKETFIPFPRFWS